MGTFPKLSYVCPIPWSELRGDERERYCSKCTRTVVNISLLTEAQRVALLRSTPPEGLCVAYYRRLSGEFVSAENPLKPAESRSLIHYGAAALTAGAMVAAIGSALAPQEAVTTAREKITTAYIQAKIEIEDSAEELFEISPGPFSPKNPLPYR